MINHARTLLMNLSGSRGYFSEYPGDELIPTDYQQLELPTYLDVIRMRLFGATPDCAMLNYRTAQLLQLIAATELQTYVLAIDPRLTYDSPSDLARTDTFTPAIKQVQGNGQFSLLGRDIPPDVTGQSRYAYQVTVSGGNVTVNRQTFPTVTTVEPVVLTNGLSQEIALPYSGYRFTINTDLPASWTVRGFSRPQSSLGEIAQGLKSVGEPYLLQLFGVTVVEPYLTFRNCWNRHPEFAYRLGGLVLALIYRTEEFRNG